MNRLLQGLIVYSIFWTDNSKGNITDLWVSRIHTRQAPCGQGNTLMCSVFYTSFSHHRLA